MPLWLAYGQIYVYFTAIYLTTLLIACPGPRRCEMFRNMVIFYGEELLAPRPTPKLENHPLSAVRNCLFNVFAATLHIWKPFLHPQLEDGPCHGYKDPLVTD
jgi:hypothetical protein